MSAAAVAQDTTTPTSGIPGIIWRQRARRWCVRAYADNKQHWVGSYRTLVEAERALENWDRQHVGKTPGKEPSPSREAKIDLTPEEVAYAMSIAHEIRGF